jgi:hypothetical protein
MQVARMAFSDFGFSFPLNYGPNPEVRDMILSHFRPKISPSPLFQRGVKIPGAKLPPLKKGGLRGI